MKRARHCISIPSAEWLVYREIRRYAGRQTGCSHSSVSFLVDIGWIVQVILATRSLPGTKLQDRLSYKTDRNYGQDNENTLRRPMLGASNVGVSGGCRQGLSLGG